MTVKGEIDEAKFRLRQQLASGDVNDVEFEASLNIDGGAVFVTFTHPEAEGSGRVKYNLGEMVKDAYRVAFGTSMPPYVVCEDCGYWAPTRYHSKGVGINMVCWLCDSSLHLESSDEEVGQ